MRYQGAFNNSARTTWELRVGSCLDPVSGLASLGDKSVDVVLADPPYEEEAHAKQRRVCRGRRLNDLDKPGAVKYEPLSFGAIAPTERSDVAAEIARITRRWALVFCQIEATTDWRRALEAGGMEYVRTMVWIKPDAQPQLTGDRPGMGHESIVVAHALGKRGKPVKKHWNGGGRRGVFDHCRHPPPAPHPTTKPLPLMAELVELFSDSGELVCDPYAGSGSTGVACGALGRHFLGWELNPEYAEIARRRLSGEAARPNPGQLDMFGGAPCLSS